MEGHGDNVGAALYGGAVLAVPHLREPVRLFSHADPGLVAVVFVPEMTGATWVARAALPEKVPHPTPPSTSRWQVVSSSGCTPATAR